MARPRLIAGVDIGYTKVCAVVAEVASDGTAQRVALSAVPGAGLQRGAVVDPDGVAAAVARALDGAQQAARARLESVLVTGATTVGSLNSRGMAAPAATGRAITADDVRRAIARATEADVPPERPALHAIPRSFAVDGRNGTSNPVGLPGRRLDAEVHVVMADASATQALVTAVERWGAAVEHVVAQPIAVAEAVLTALERERGVAVADLGAGGTGLCIFVDGSPWHTTTVPVGGRHVTQDIATVLGIGYDVAEELKLAAGQASVGAADLEEPIPVAQMTGRESFEVTRRELCEIIEARARELIGLIGGELRRSGYAGLLPAGLVLTGGAAQLPGIARVASEMLEMRVRIGQPEAVGDVDRAGPAQASVIGLLLWAMRSTARRWWTYEAPPQGPTAAGRAQPALGRWLKARLSAVRRSERPR